MSTTTNMFATKKKNNFNRVKILALTEMKLYIKKTITDEQVQLQKTANVTYIQMTQMALESSDFMTFGSNQPMNTSYIVIYAVILR